MIKSSDFVSALESQGYDFFTGVPCSYFKDVINYVIANADSYYAAPNEGSALALASGAHLGGRGAVVMIQNSGLGNLINPLTSLCMIYQIPVLLFVSGRAYGVQDEPQHEIIGAKMAQMLTALGVGFRDLPQDESFQPAVNEAIQFCKTKQQPFVFFVKKDTFEKFKTPKKDTSGIYPLKRIDTVKILSSLMAPPDFLFATTGMISRELFAVCDRPGNFYMQGSMGHIAALAMGTAIAQPSSRVVVLDGDGAFLMHMGTASMVGFYGQKNLIHIVLDNESYETTGDQDTTSTTTDFAAIAKACGYTKVMDAANEVDLRKAWNDLKDTEGPVFLRIKINRNETADIPRITTKYTAAQITENFRKHALRQPAAAKNTR